MRYIKVSKVEIKEITKFLIEKRIIFHPVISPQGCPDFTSCSGRSFALILDRNILTKLIDLCLNGGLKDKFQMQMLGNLLFWATINNVEINAGIALLEYSVSKENTVAASRERNTFQRISEYYDPNTWKDLSTGKIDVIPVLPQSLSVTDHEFDAEDEHFKMHYAEMLHLMCLYFRSNLSGEAKVYNFLDWNDKNLLFCCYTVTYATLLFSRKVKQFTKIRSLSDALSKCQNQAWDLTYLSMWSTLYWHEKEADTVWLFSTMDSDLKKVFIKTHDDGTDVFIDCFGLKKGRFIKDHYDEIIRNRVKPKIRAEGLDHLIEEERRQLALAIDYMISI